MAGQMKAKPTKTKEGRNVKQHFGTWKNFVRATTKKGLEVKQKFYITISCKKMPECNAMEVAKQETKEKYNLALKQIKGVGVLCADPTKLEYWGIPEGICEQFYKHTGIKQLFEWQVSCLLKNERVI
jgi:hypothetical protein